MGSTTRINLSRRSFVASAHRHVRKLAGLSGGRHASSLSRIRWGTRVVDLRAEHIRSGNGAVCSRT